MIELLRQRRSVRRYQDRAVEPEKVALLKEALLRSPTSRNLRPWRFVVVTDKTMLKKLAQCKPHGAAFLEKAPLGIVVCGDATESDVWIEDGSIASILVQMTAQSLGLGSCWIQVRCRDYNDEQSSESYIQQLLDLHEHVQVLSVIAIGYPDEVKEPIPTSSLDHDKIKEL